MLASPGAARGRFQGHPCGTKNVGNVDHCEMQVWAWASPKVKRQSKAVVLLCIKRMLAAQQASNRSRQAFSHAAPPQLRDTHLKRTTSTRYNNGSCRCWFAFPVFRCLFCPFPRCLCACVQPSPDERHETPPSWRCARGVLDVCR